MELSSLLRNIEEDSVSILQGLALLEQTRVKGQSVTRKPGVAGKSAQLHRRLQTSFKQLETDLVHTLRRNKGKYSQSSIPAVKNEERASLNYYEIPLEEATTLIDRNKFDDLFMHLQSWALRHEAIADGFLTTQFDKGRKLAISELDLNHEEVAQKNPDHSKSLFNRFSEDLTNQKNALLHGTNRSYGIRWNINNSSTLGAFCLYTRRLFDAEKYVLENLSENVANFGILEGYRNGAVDVTNHILDASGYIHPVGLSLNESTIPEDIKKQLPSYRFKGPKENSCASCYEKHGLTIYAFNLNTIPVCQDVCSHNLACRHWWSLVDDN